MYIRMQKQPAERVTAKTNSPGTRSIKRYPMKFSLLAIFSVLLLSHPAFSQDSIFKTSGEVIQAKILEVSPSEIKYKKFNFLDGPTYIESRSGIDYVIYSNGLKEKMLVTAAPPKPAPADGGGSDYYDPNTQKSLHVDKMQPYGAAKYRFEGRKIGEREMQSVLMKTQDRQIVQLVQNSKDAHKLQYIGFAAFPLGIASIYVLGNSVGSYGRVSSGAVAGGLLLLGGSIACPIISGVFKHKRIVYNRKAVELYNQRY
jgi:hypothetical protein